MREHPQLTLADVDYMTMYATAVAGHPGWEGRMNLYAGRVYVWHGEVGATAWDVAGDLDDLFEEVADPSTLAGWLRRVCEFELAFLGLRTDPDHPTAEVVELADAYPHWVRAMVYPM